jgi:hypothetical protein
MRINLTSAIIKSNKGGNKIAYDGYLYNFKKINISKKTWRCNKRGCSSLLKNKLYSELIEVGTHNHIKDDIKYNRVLIKHKIKTRSIASSETPRQVVLNVLKKNKEVVIPLDLKKLNNVVNNERKDYNLLLKKVMIYLQITNENKNFLQYDSGTKDENRILIFKTDDNLKYLLYSRVLVCDGTFKSAPTNFEQLFIIQEKI